MRFVLSVLLSVCALYGTQAVAATSSDGVIIRQVIQEVNAYRQQHRLPPLQLVSYLSHEAQVHSEEMAQHRIPFGHARFQERVKHMYAAVDSPAGAAENVAYNYRNGTEVVKNWLTSPHHLANIRGHYRYTGIGIARDQKGKLYFTQLFLMAA